MKFVISVIFIALFASFAVAQEYEYGKPDDLKGLTTVYIDTHGNIKDREKIIEEIKKAKLDLTAVDAKSDATIFINFSTTTSRQAVGRTIVNPVDPQYNAHVVSEYDLEAGDGMVTVKGKSPTVPRVVLNFHGGRRNPAGDFVKKFIKAYKEANGLK